MYSPKSKNRLYIDSDYTIKQHKPLLYCIKNKVTVIETWSGNIQTVEFPIFHYFFLFLKSVFYLWNFILIKDFFCICCFFGPNRFLSVFTVNDEGLAHAHSSRTATKRMRLKLENPLFAYAHLLKLKLIFVLNCWFVFHICCSYFRGQIMSLFMCFISIF